MRRTRTSRSLSLPVVSLAALAAAGCSDDSTDAGDRTAAVGACADTTQVYALPTPLWEGSATQLTPPVGDKANEFLKGLRPEWTAQLPLVDGWARRPTLVIPLDGAATAADGSGVTVYTRAAGSEYAALDNTFTAELENNGNTLILQPLNPFKTEHTDAVVVVAPSAVTGATALPACGADGTAHPAYAAAAQALTGTAPESALTLPMRLNTNTFELKRLYEKLTTTPVLEVASVEAKPLADVTGQENVAAHVRDNIAQGLLSLPLYQDENLLLAIGADGAPEAQGTTAPGFVVVLPKTGTAPYPFVLFQHGGGQDKALGVTTSAVLAEAGFAVVAIDLVGHGDRAEGDQANDLDILNFKHPLITRGNLRQSSADHIAVVTGVDALNAAVEPIFGTPTALDKNEIYYQGMSMGAFTGSFTFFSADNIKAASLFVGGGGFPEILSSGAFSLMVSDVFTKEGIELRVVHALTETLMAAADPISYSAVESRDAAPRTALFFEAIGDKLVPNASTDLMARAFGATNAEPTHHDVAHMTATALPAQGGFTWKGESAEATRLLIQAPMNEISPDAPMGLKHGALILQPYSQELLTHCYAGMVAGDACEIIDTGFSEH